MSDKWINIREDVAWQVVQQIVDEYHSLLGFKNYILNFFRQNEMNNGHAKWSLALKGSKGFEDRSGTPIPHLSFLLPGSSRLTELFFNYFALFSSLLSPF